MYEIQKAPPRLLKACFRFSRSLFFHFPVFWNQFLLLRVRPSGCWPRSSYSLTCKFLKIDYLKLNFLCFNRININFSKLNYLFHQNSIFQLSISPKTNCDTLCKTVPTVGNEIFTEQIKMLSKAIFMKNEFISHSGPLDPVVSLHFMKWSWSLILPHEN